MVFINRPGNTVTSFSLSADHPHSLQAVETEDGSLTLRSERFGATYHSVQGAKEESRHVFINHGLLHFLDQHPRKELHILEIGFGTGLNAFLTFLEAERLALKVYYHTVEAFPVPMETVKQLNFSQGHLPLEQLVFEKMHEQAWGVEQKLSAYFYFGKHFKKIETFQLSQSIDLIYFDAFSPKEQPELWTEDIFKKMYMLLTEKGMLVTYCAQGQMKRNMKAAGFRVRALKGFAAKREMTVGYRA